MIIVGFENDIIQLFEEFNEFLIGIIIAIIIDYHEMHRNEMGVIKICFTWAKKIFLVKGNISCDKLVIKFKTFMHCSH